MAKRKCFALTFVLSLLGSSAALAQSVLVVEARGLPGKVDGEFASVVKRELGKMKVKVSKAKVPSGSARLAALADLGGNGKYDFVVDCEGSSKKLAVMVVGGSGEVVLDKTYTLPKSSKKHKGAVADAARAAAKAVKSRAGQAEETSPQPVVSSRGAGGEEASSGSGSTGRSDPFASAASAPWSGGASGSSAADSGDDEDEGGKDPIAASPDKAVATTTPSRPRRPGDGGFGMALALGGGGGGYTETLNSRSNPGDRDINVSMSPQFGGGLSLELSRDLHIDLRGVRQSASLKPDVAATASEITANRLVASAQASYAVVEGQWPLAGMVGFTFESATTNEQPEILWIPEHSAWNVVLGATFSNGDLSTEGLATEIAAGIIPYGSHSRKADDLTVSSRALGGQAHLRLRYQMPQLLGDSLGFFVEALGAARYLMLSPSNSPQPTGTTTRDQALPLGDVDSSRLDYGATVSVGLALRP